MKSAEIEVGRYYAVTTWLSRKRPPNAKYLNRAKVTMVANGRATLDSYPHEVPVKYVLRTWAENKRILDADKAEQSEALIEAQAQRAELEKYLPASIFAEGVNEEGKDYVEDGVLSGKFEVEEYGDGSGISGNRETIWMSDMVEIVKAAYEKGASDRADAGSWTDYQRDMSS